MMKCLVTTINVSNRILEPLRKLGYDKSGSQVRILCQCKSMADANRQAEAQLGIKKVFISEFTAETRNEHDLTAAMELGGVFIE